MKTKLEGIIKVICCVCQKSLGEKPGEGCSGISHGICPKCYTDTMTKIRMTKQARIENN